MDIKVCMLAAPAALIIAFGSPRHANAQAKPALTQNIDEPGRNAFAFTANASGGFASFNVPAGKRYVIDLYSVSCAFPAAGSDYLTEATAEIYTQGVVISVEAPAHFEYSNVNYNFYAATGTGPLYADPGKPIFIIANAEKNSVFPVSCGINVTGHIINNP